jgi:hypothetical protein
MLEFFKVTGTQLGTVGRVMLAQVRGVGATGDDDNAEPMDSVEVHTQIGFESRPSLTDTTEILVVRDGDEIIGLMIVDKGRTAKLGDTPALEEGETRVSSAKEPSSMARFRASGEVLVNAKVGQKVTIQADAATMVLDAAGGITITAKTGQKFTAQSDTGKVEISAAGAIAVSPKAGQDVTLDGGDKKIATEATLCEDHDHIVTFGLNDNVTGAPITGTITVHTKMNQGIQAATCASHAKATAT